MARITKLHKKWMREPKYRQAYTAFEEKFVLASAVIDVRNRARLTQEDLARKMGTTQPVIARLESGFAAVDAHAGTARGCHRFAPHDQLRARTAKRRSVST